MGRNLDDFFDSIMTHRFVPEKVFPNTPFKVSTDPSREKEAVYSEGAAASLRRPGSDGFVVDSKGTADFNPSDATKAELSQQHAAGRHADNEGDNQVQVQFVKKYCPDCQAGR